MIKKKNSEKSKFEGQKSRKFGHLITQFEQVQMKKLHEGKRIDDFCAGDRIKVVVAIYEGGEYSREQNFEGICVRRKNRGVCSSFLVRKIVDGIGVERVFPLYSNTVKSVIRTGVGKSRRAAIYYIRNLSGKRLSKALGIKDVNIKKN